MGANITKEQHESFGEALKMATQALVIIEHAAINSQGYESRPRKLAQKANTALLLLRAELESIARFSAPDNPAVDRYYFGQAVAKTTQSA